MTGNPAPEPPVSQEPTDDLQAIHVLYSAWFGAMETGDVERILELVTDDVILKGGGGPAVRGRDALEVSLRDFLEQYTEEVEYSLDEVEVAGDWAWARIDESVLIIPKDDRPPVRVTGMHLAVLRRTGDDGWRIARDIAAAAPEE